MTNYALGLDMGTSSIGWATIALADDGEPLGLLDWSARIFPSGREDKTNEPLAAARRMAHGISRRTDRIKMRRRNLLKQMVKYGLMPADVTQQKALEIIEPLKLRNQGVTQSLDIHSFGRALFHLQQRRGFQSNRKDSDEESKGAIASASNDLQGALTAQNITLGQFLYFRQQQGKTTRATKKFAGTKVEYDYYPTRSMVQNEFEKLWDTQKKHHPNILTQEAYDAIYKAIFYQRPLKAQPRGKCLFFNNEDRLPAAMPSAQRFRILKEIQNIRIKGTAHPANGTPLTPQQKQKLFDALCLQKEMKEEKIKSLLNIASQDSINLFAKGVREKLQGDETAAEMRREAGKEKEGSTKKPSKGRYGKDWDNLSLAQQDAIVGLLTDTIEKITEKGTKRLLNDEEIVSILIEEHGLSATQAEDVLNAKLNNNLLKYGATMVSKLLPLLESGMSEYEAITSLGYNHSMKFTGELLDELPYYGAIEDLRAHIVPMPNASDLMVKQYGRVSNPTVHVALNQLRKLINQLVARYGTHPTYINLEMVRELKKGQKEINEINKNININTSERKKITEEIEAHGQEATPHFIAKMKLWSELDAQPQNRTCVYTGRNICIADVLSERTEIEHILPRSRTLDDTAANKTLTFREINAAKGNATPYEFFSATKELFGKTISYDDVWERANSLKASKKWRFSKDAMEVFESKAKKIILGGSLDGNVNTELENVAARHLVDTSYIAKFAKKYVAYSCKKGENGVMATPGTLTGLLRKAWGLNHLIAQTNEKDRSDHRHHAVDALVIALTTRSMVKRVADASKRSEVKGVSLVKEILPPWDNFALPALKARCDEIIISHKPDHGSPAQGFGTTGQLHKDTAYGLTKIAPQKKGYGVFVTRWTADSFKKVKDLEDIRDIRLRETIKSYISRSLGDCPIENVSDKEVARLVAQYMLEKGIKGIRCLEERPLEVMIPIQHQQTKEAYKYFVGGSNHCAEIYMTSTGKLAGKWQIEIISTFNANQKGFVPKWRKEFPDAHLVMRLHGNDMVAYDDGNGKSVICRVRKISADGRVFIVPHATTSPTRIDKETIGRSPSVYQQMNLRKVSVRIDGVVFDPQNPTSKEV